MGDEVAKAGEEGLVGPPERRLSAGPRLLGVRYRRAAGVSLPCKATGFLMKSLRVRRRDTFLDMGSGTGVVGIYAARRGADVTAVDISLRAVSETAANAARNRVRIRVVRGDLFERVPGRFVRIAFNAPYVRLTRSGAEDKRTRDRTRASRLGTVTRFLRELPAHLDEGGMGYLVLSSASPVPLFEGIAREAGLEWEIRKTSRSPRERTQLVGLRLANRRRPVRANSAPSSSRNGSSNRGDAFP